MPRAIEISLTLALLIAVAPVAIAVALAVRIGLGRPVLFRQVRAGRGGHPVVIHKFRSMSDARDASGALLPDAERTNGVGRVIRRYRFDEIPQLLSILRGDTALVGPRPLLPETVSGFGPAGDVRARVRPGLTGWAQISGNSRLSDIEKVSLDLWYVEHRSATLDLAILGMTIRTLLIGEIRAEERIRAARDGLSAQAGLGAGRP
ncbi:sugar transferase [Palleronia abyssalis]|uniref:Putative sugar transferase EpsL n=1 Tax=Palleronia abyssalis TaxID=1501240 RepID=A0A2R8BYK1_9RHOB|nr:sugar transferase [Palleronia abyssalis]SPJ25224.1 putative sugar transferase EpsL [Palleronia abyssalis]